MATVNYPFHRILHQWGADAADGYNDNPYSEATSHTNLTPTGTHGSDWDTVPSTAEYLRQAGHGWVTGSGVVSHYMSLDARYRNESGGGAGMMSYRIWDITNSAALVVFSTSQRGFHATAKAITAPTTDADTRYRLEYSLETDDEADFKWAAWEMIHKVGTEDEP